MTKRLNKNGMARVVVQALYNQRELPAADNHRVIRLASKTTLTTLTRFYRDALLILDLSSKKGGRS